MQHSDHGFGIITLAGDNKGALMKANMEELKDTDGVMRDDDRGMFTYTNSNYQAIYNSILLGESCTADDPGVDVVISEYVEDKEGEEKQEKERKEADKSKRSTKEELRGERRRDSEQKDT